MTSDVAQVRQLFDAFYAADEARMSELIGDDFVTHGPGGGTGDAEGWKAMAKQITAALPDNRTEIRRHLRGRRPGHGSLHVDGARTPAPELFGVAPTGKQLARPAASRSTASTAVASSSAGVRTT